MSAPLIVTRPAARRFLRRILGFDPPFADIATALAHHGYIQIDPINVCGRMHDLILRNRVVGYREGDLMRHLHGEGDPAAPGGRKAAAVRTAFEHHLPDTHILVAFPLEAWPHLRRAMHARTKLRSAWLGGLTPRERVLAERLLAEVAERGPLGSEDFEDDSRRARRVWGTATFVKSTLQKLFFHGRLLIAQRLSHRRRYDLPERVLPAEILALPEPTAAATARWLALLKLRQRRLTRLKREELALVADAVQPVAIEGCPPLFCLRADAPLLESIAATGSALPTPPPPLSTTPTLLAPLDPLIYDRAVTAALWEFDYTWEVYTPAPKRTRGYYALPVLADTALVGHLDLKADRVARKLVVQNRRLRRGHSAAAARHALARWLGLK